MKTRTTIIIMLGVVIALFGLLGWRVFYLQNYGPVQYRRDSRRQQFATVTEKPQRGVIVDRCGRILAASNKVETVFIDMATVSDVEVKKEIANRLQEILGIGGHIICGMMEDGNPRFVKIKVGITPTERVAIQKARLPGVGIRSDWKRWIPCETVP